MPLIEVSLVEGRSEAKIQNLINALTRATVEALDVPVDSVRVLVRELPATHWAAGGRTIADRRDS